MPWSRTDSGGWVWREPRWTLGWQVQDWAETYFKVPGGKFYGEPLQFTGWQSMFLADWYAVDEFGRWVFSRGLVRLAKKSGKSPVGGVVLAANLCGPSVFDGWDASGEPVGRPHESPWCQVMAVSEDQTANTYTPFATMLRESDLVDELGLDVGVSATVFRGRREAKAEVVTSAAGSREGQPTTGGVVGDEAQSWTKSNGGRRLYRTARRNCAPLGARVLMLANAYEPGMETVAEDIETAAATEPGCLLYGPQYQVEGTDLGDREQVMRNLGAVYRDVPWVDVESIAGDAMTVDQDVFEAQRFYFNWPAGDGAVLCADPQSEVDNLEDGAPVAVGFHGPSPKQATSLVAVHMVTGVAYLLGLWERPSSLPLRQPWEVPRDQVEAAVEAAFSGFEVAHLKADPSGWRAEVARWKNEWEKTVTSLPRSERSLVDEAVEATQTALQHGQLRLSAGAPDEMLGVHVRRCLVSRRSTGSKVIRSLVAPEEGRVDCAVALSWAWQARLEALAKGWEPQAPPTEMIAMWA